MIRIIRNLLKQLGFEDAAGAASVTADATDTDAVLADLAAGRIGVAEAEQLLGDRAG